MDAMPLHQVPQEVREDAAKGISDFMIGLVRIYETDSGQDADLAGSGTLVQFDDTYGILTAYHVLEYLRNTQEIGLILASRVRPRMHRFTLRAEVLRPLKIAHRDAVGRPRFRVIDSSQGSCRIAQNLVL